MAVWPPPFDHGSPIVSYEVSVDDTPAALIDGATFGDLATYVIAGVVPASEHNFTVSMRTGGHGQPILASSI